jgi:uncharacterized protein YciI
MLIVRHSAKRDSSSTVSRRILSDDMSRRFVYFYLMRPFPKQIQQVVGAHVEYWQRADVEQYRGGPFADRSGGLIEFAAQDLRHATNIAGKDPFVSAGLVEASWLKEWNPE